jgi:microcystin-dependent protein
MATPYIGEVRLFGGNFAPLGWVFCDGRLLSIASNQALFSLIGTTYGGDGKTTFCVPDLRGRVPVHVGGQFTLGQPGGSETVSLTTAQLPPHQHSPAAVSGPGGSGSPKSAIWAGASSSIYAAGTANAPMNAAAGSPAGGGRPHDNLSPFLVLSFIIALEGAYPSQS